MLFQRLWVWAIVAMPTQTCRHLCLDKLGGRRILLTAPFPRTPPLPLYHPHHADRGPNSDRLVACHMHTVTWLIKHLPWRSKDVAAAERVSLSGRYLIKVIRSNTDINIRVNHEGLIHFHRSVGELGVVGRENETSDLAYLFFCGWREGKRKKCFDTILV